ncbi:hypothetical protein MTR67_002427 [Solanum verrucosum]|uniref:Integrase zinc-binding domain-containing protein n=1 Tax=Solanum verrucosum TaxID=315347 RepID=A0AAF0PQJ2_SOLVR|nr:hypothetical protein MTR67_002427 [Solanum verrucosum]
MVKEGIILWDKISGEGMQEYQAKVKVIAKLPLTISVKGVRSFLGECTSHIIRRFVPEVEVNAILKACHTSQVGGHHSRVRTSAIVLQRGYYWPSLYHNTHSLVKQCFECQNNGVVWRKHELVYRKSCHLSIELEHMALWALKALNLNWGDSLKGRVNQLRDLEEFWL